jgi:hypothetical protein
MKGSRPLDGNQVVHHRECQEEGPQRSWQMRVDDREDGQGEGDVRGGGNGPTPERFRARAEVDDHVDECGKDHAAHCCRHRDDRFCGLPQFPGHEFALELQPRNEEEHGQEPVGGPVAQAQFEMPGGVADLDVAQREVAVREG